jgi:hypothetical protein
MSPLSHLQGMVLTCLGVGQQQNSACGVGYYRRRNHKRAGPANRILMSRYDNEFTILCRFPNLTVCRQSGARSLALSHMVMKL